MREYEHYRDQAAKSLYGLVFESPPVTSIEHVARRAHGIVSLASHDSLSEITFIVCELWNLFPLHIQQTAICED